MANHPRVFLLLLLAFAVSGSAADKKEPLTKEQKEYSKRCPLIMAGKWHDLTIKQLRSGEHYQQHPIVSYKIGEDGSVTHVRLERSSGVPRIDKDFVEQTALNRYKPRRAGCGVIETKMSLTIDWY